MIATKKLVPTRPKINLECSFDEFLLITALLGNCAGEDPSYKMYSACNNLLSEIEPQYNNKAIFLLKKEFNLQLKCDINLTKVS